MEMGKGGGRDSQSLESLEVCVQLKRSQINIPYCCPSHKKVEEFKNKKKIRLEKKETMIDLCVKEGRWIGLMGNAGLCKSRRSSLI